MEKSQDLMLTFLKQQLRVVANTILDIRLHTRAMSDDEAMTLMTDGAFQEQQEATAKLQRAKLSSCQLPTYFLGYREWKKLSEQMKKIDPSILPGAFHRKALAQGDKAVGDQHLDWLEAHMKMIQQDMETNLSEFSPGMAQQMPLPAKTPLDNPPPPLPQDPPNVGKGPMGSSGLGGGN